MKLNPRMNAIRLHHNGGPEVLVYEQAYRPCIEPGEVLVRVHAAGITPTELSWLGCVTRAVIPAHEMSGTIAAVGPHVADIKVGEEVYGLPPFDRNGAAAEYVALPATAVAPKPTSIGHVEAAALPLSGLTAWQALRVHGEVKAGQRVLIHGGAGGVGSLAVQLAKYLGAETIATCSAMNAAFVRQLGADRVVDYTDEPFDCFLCDVDFVLDTVGGETLSRSWSVMKRGGTLVSIAEKPSEKSATDFGVRGIYFIVEPNTAHLTELAKLVDRGSIRPILSKVFPLANARDAYEFGLRGHMCGKIVLNLSDRTFPVES